MKYFYLLILSLLPILGFSQYNFEPGYIIKSNGDTVRGQIDYKAWNRNPDRINFQSGNNISGFTPDEIREFSITGELEKYVAYKGTVSADVTIFPRLPHHLDTSSIVVNTFFKCIISGKNVSLYSYVDNIKSRFFIGEKNERPAELQYHQYYSEDNSQAVKSEIYKGQLTILANKYNPEKKSLLNRINNSLYNQSSFEEIVNELNHDKIDKDLTTVNRFFIAVGIDRSSTSFSGDNGFTGTKAAISYSPRISAGYDVFNSRKKQNLIFRLEATLSYLSPTFKANFPIGGLDRTATYTFNRYAIAFAPQLIYNIYNADEFKFFVGAGAALNACIYTNNKRTFDASGTTYSDDDPYKVNAIVLNFPVEAGIVLDKKTEINFTYFTKSSLTNNPSYSLNSQSFNIGIKRYLGH